MTAAELMDRIQQMSSEDKMLSLVQPAIEVGKRGRPTSKAELVHQQRAKSFIEELQDEQLDEVYLKLSISNTTGVVGGQKKGGPGVKKTCSLCKIRGFTQNIFHRKNACPYAVSDEYGASEVEKGSDPVSNEELAGLCLPNEFKLCLDPFQYVLYEHKHKADERRGFYVEQWYRGEVISFPMGRGEKRGDLLNMTASKCTIVGSEPTQKKKRGDKQSSRKVSFQVFK